jgi:hypothetical protein
VVLQVLFLERPSCTTRLKRAAWLRSGLRCEAPLVYQASICHTIHDTSDWMQWRSDQATTVTGDLLKTDVKLAWSAFCCRMPCSDQQNGVTYGRYASMLKGRATGGCKTDPEPTTNCMSHQSKNRQYAALKLLKHQLRNETEPPIPCLLRG